LPLKSVNDLNWKRADIQ